MNRIKAKQIIPVLIVLFAAAAGILFLAQPKLPQVTDWKKEFTPINESCFFYDAIYTDYSKFPYKTKKLGRGLKRYIKNLKFENNQIGFSEYNEYLNHNYDCGIKNDYIIDDNGFYLSSIFRLSCSGGIAFIRTCDPALLYKFPIKTNTPVNFREEMLVPRYQNWQKIEDTEKIYYDITCTGYQNVKTYAGNFDAYKFIYTVPENMKNSGRALKELWYVPGMTDVKIIDNIIDKKIKYEYILTGYKIPGKNSTP